MPKDVRNARTPEGSEVRMEKYSEYGFINSVKSAKCIRMRKPHDLKTCWI